MKKINEQRLIQHFIELIKIDSESRDEKEIAQTLAKQLAELGFEVHPLAVPEHISNGFNIYARLEGSLAGSTLFSCHMDTVTPGKGIEPEIVDGIIRSKGNTILGGDDKSGIAAIMEAVRSLREQGREHQTIEIAFTVYEEGGLNGSKHFDMSYIKSNQAIVLDSSGTVGDIITVAPGQQNLKVTIEGKPAHAGLAPELGINALTVAADAIASMKLSRIDEETTANIGVVKGGAATNIVMPDLYLEAEARSLDADKLSAQVSHMQAAFESAAEKHGAKVNIETARSYDAYRIDDNDPLVMGVKAAFTTNDICPQLKSTGGGSDANVFNGKGLKTINMATGMSKVHTTDEFIAIDDLEKITEFLHTYLTQ